LSDTESQTLTIPSATSPGLYYILFAADATNVVNESNENNNTACVQLFIDNSISIFDTCISAAALDIYPNPTSGIIRIELNHFNSRLSKIILTDLNGKHIIVKESENLDYKDISNVKSGMYLLLIQDTKGEQAIFKILKTVQDS